MRSREAGRCYQEMTSDTITRSDCSVHMHAWGVSFGNSPMSLGLYVRHRGG